MDTQSLLDDRRQKDEIFAGHRSPLDPADLAAFAGLDPADLAAFAGLDYYPPNPDLVFTLDVRSTERARLRVQTSDGREVVHERAGTVGFEVDGREVELVLYETGHPGYFLPFRDKTSGAETYGAGRYLDIEPNADGTVTLDFNRAYNPLCAYSDAFSCPLPPAENWLTVPIEAGERAYRR